MGTKFLSGMMRKFWEEMRQRWWLHNTGNVLNASESFTLKQ